MTFDIQPGGVWYHGSDRLFDRLLAGSTVTQWRGLAEAFSHKPVWLSYDDCGTITHGGVLPGFLYVIDEPVQLDRDVYQHPRTSMDPGAEFLTRRDLKVRLVASLPGNGLIRQAGPADAEDLHRLNELFNGPGDANPGDIRQSLADNPMESVTVAEVDGKLVGFICAQLRRSFCYARPGAELTEVFVQKEHRRRGLAQAMLLFAEECCRRSWNVSEITLLTGGDNSPAQALYEGAGYLREGEVLYKKEL